MEEQITDVKGIPRISVESSNIKEIGYDQASKILMVKFHNGGLYAYDAVPAEMFDELKSAPSKGKFFIANVKGKYSFRKVGG